MQQKSQVLLLLLLVLPLISIAQLSQEQANKIDKIFAKWDQEDKPGCALAVIKDGTILYQKGYGMADLEHDIPINSKSIFYIGSVSKQFVSLCMLLLEEQDKIDLDVDIRTYLPEFPDYGHTISIRNLIHHTSGIRDNLTLWELAGRSHLDEIPESEIYELIMRQEQLNFEPGTEYRYSNSCYFMMSLILERVTGQSLREYADEHIFQPLEMKHTFFGDDNRRIIKNRAFGYGTAPDGSIENMIMRFDLVGSGGLYSNVEDLALWDQNFYDNKLGTRGQALITDMLTNGRFNDGSEVDYAFALNKGEYKGLPTVSHSGSLGGYRAFYLRFPKEQFSVIILGNVTTLYPGLKAYMIADVCLKDQFLPKEQPKKIILPKTISLTKEQLKAFTGHYWLPKNSAAVKIYIEGDTLRYGYRHNQAHTLLPIGENVFLVEGSTDLVVTTFDTETHTFTNTFNGRLTHIGYAFDDPIEGKLENLTSYSGRYYAPELNFHYDLEIEDDTLILKIGEAETHYLLPISKSIFALENDWNVEFEMDLKQKVAGFILNAGWVSGLRFERVRR